MEIKGKTALVTGGALRVGKAIAWALAMEGCHVLIHYNRSKKEALKLIEHIRSFNVNAWAIKANLQDAEETRNLIPLCIHESNKIDILINNAAIFTEGNGLATTLDDWEREFAINLRAPFFLSQSFAKHFKESNGHIINLLDARIQSPGYDYFVYRLTKSTLASMTQNLALELAPNIQVNAIAPGAVLPPTGSSEKNFGGQIPLQRTGNPESIAQTVLHFLKNDFLTGSILRIDGGEFL